MNIDPIGTQPVMQAGKESLPADPLMALFAVFLGDAGALVESGASASGKDEETLLAPAAVPPMPTIGLPLVPFVSSSPVAGATVADAAIETPASAVAAVGTDAIDMEARTGDTPREAEPEAAAMPITVPKIEAILPTTEEAVAAAKFAAKEVSTPAAQSAAAPSTEPTDLAIKLAPTVSLAAPAIGPKAQTAATAEKKSAAGAPSAETAPRATGPVTVTIERAEPTPRAGAAQPKEAGAALTSAAKPVLEDEPSIEPAEADASAVTFSLGAAQAKEPIARPERATPAPMMNTPLHTPTEQVAHRIEKALESGEDRIRIELKPASLGHVEVQLHIADDGRVAAVVSAERADTLALLQSDVRSLEQALKDAGLKPDAGSLSFNLRQGEGQGGGHQPDARGHRRRADADGSNFTIDTVTDAAPGARAPRGSLDIRI